MAIGFFISNHYNYQDFESKQEKTITDSFMKADVEKMIRSCIEYSVKDSLSETGIKKDTLNEYNELVRSEIVSCTSPLLDEMKKQDYSITKGILIINSEIHPETIEVKIRYPLEIEKYSQKIKLEEFDYSFDRSNYVHIPRGITKSEIRIQAANGKAELRIPKGVKISDEKGNPVENIGIKIIDHNFDGLENKYLLGELVYQNFPKGAYFSEPIEMSIEFDRKEIPEGYSENNLRIAYWDEKKNIWYAPPTSIKNNIATANITHFTPFAVTWLKPILIQTLMFKTRFQPTQGSSGFSEDRKGAWLIKGEQGSQEGTATLHKDYYIAAYNDFDRADTTHYLNMYGEGINAVQGLYPYDPETKQGYQDFKVIREIFQKSFISYNTLEYGYYLDPENSESSEFINCEDYNPYNIGNVKYGLDENDYPWVIQNELPDYIEDELAKGEITLPYKEFGWHNLQCAGGRVLPGEDSEFAEFITFEPKGNAVIGIGKMELKNPFYNPEPKFLINPYVYPMKDTISVDYPDGYYKAGEDFSYSFYCDFIKFDDGEIIKEEYSNGITKYGIYGINAFKKYDHPLSRAEMNAQCEMFWLVLGNGEIYTNSPGPEKKDEEGLSIVYDDLTPLDYKQGLIAEVLGAALLKDNEFGIFLGKIISKLV